MNVYLTKIRAIDPQTGELCDWCGPRIEARSMYEARMFCESNGLGYCKITGKLRDEIEIKNQDICLN